MDYTPTYDPGTTRYLDFTEGMMKLCLNEIDHAEVNDLDTELAAGANALRRLYKRSEATRRYNKAARFAYTLTNKMDLFSDKADIRAAFDYLTNLKVVVLLDNPLSPYWHSYEANKYMWTDKHRSYYLKIYDQLSYLVKLLGAYKF